MTSTEVRINNWVFDELDTKVRQIEPLDFFSDTFKYLTPIPLDEQWLLKFGFSKLKQDAYFEKQVSDKIFFRIDLIDRFCQLDRYQENIERQHKVIIPKPTKYVHELQNLYHSLTGKELTLNK